MNPIMRRRFSVEATIQQPAHAGGAAGDSLAIRCMQPVSVGARTAERFKLATTFNLWETFTGFDSSIKSGWVLTIGSASYAIKATGEYNLGRDPVTQLVMELRQ